MLAADARAQPQGEPAEYGGAADPLEGRRNAQQARENIERGREITDEIAEHLRGSFARERVQSQASGSELQARAQATTQNVQDKARQVREKTEQSSARAQERLRSAGHEAHNRADTAMSRSGDNLQKLSANLRAQRPDGPAGRFVDQAAGALDRSGQYLQRATPTDVRGDLEQVMRQHPLETILLGLGAGYLLNRATSQRR